MAGMGKAQDQAVDLSQDFDVTGDGTRVVVVAHVGAPFLDRHRRRESLAIEVGRDHAMAVLLEGVDDGAEQRVVKAVGEGMAAHDLD